MALVVAALAAAPSVVADVDVRTAVLVVDVGNGHEHCDHALEENCLVSTTRLDEPGESRIDAEQRIDHVRIATDLATIKDPLGENWVLPDDSIAVRGDEIIIRHPVFRTLTEQWGAVPDPLQDSPYRVVLRQENITLYYFGPGPRNETTVDHRAFVLTYNNDTLCYEECGPFTAYDRYDYNSDAVIAANIDFVCGNPFPFPLKEECRGLPLETINSTVQGNTPRLDYGVQLYNVTVATDPSLMNISGSADENQTVDDGTLASERSAEDPSEPSLANDSVVVQVQSPVAPPRDDGPGEPAKPSVVPGPIKASGEPGETKDPWWEHPVAVAAGGVISGLLIWLLYSRFKDQRELLASPVRRKIMVLAKEQPGITQKEICHHIGRTRQTISHHLKLLEKTQVVTLRRQDETIHVFLADALQPVPPPKATLARRILQFVLARQSVSRADVHKEFESVALRTRNHAIKSNIKSGKVEELETPDGLRLRPRSTS